MSSNKKRLSLGWVLGISLGFACSAGVVNAGSIADSYATGDTLTAVKMTAVKTAVNDNDTRITNLQGNAGAGTCVGNNASDIMVRVGPTCVDKYRVSLYDGTGASASPTTTASCGEEAAGTVCANVVAQSRSAGTRATGVTVNWGQAARACANAGKRLLTPAEWVMAWQRSKTGLTDVADMVSSSTQAEFVDSVQPGSGPDLRLRVGVMGESYDTGGGLLTLEYGSIMWSQTDPTYTNLGFRCAR